jgi:hypothetical protein
MRWRVQLGINSTSDVLEILPKLDESLGGIQFGKFPNITSTINP